MPPVRLEQAHGKAAAGAYACLILVARKWSVHDSPQCYVPVPLPCAAGPPPSETFCTFLYSSSRARCISKSA
jgi:hypothetical protein